MNQANPKLAKLIAFVESHGNKVISFTETTITATVELMHANGQWETAQETFPATVSGARDWLGY